MVGFFFLVIFVRQRKNYGNKLGIKGWSVMIGTEQRQVSETIEDLTSNFCSKGMINFFVYGLFSLSSLCISAVLFVYNPKI